VRYQSRDNQSRDVARKFKGSIKYSLFGWLYLLGCRLSELRILELLEGFCQSLQNNIEFVYANETDWVWALKGRHEPSQIKLSPAEAKSRSTEFGSFCSRLIENYEDEVRLARCLSIKMDATCRYEWSASNFCAVG
jgi:TLR4 regulator and MIR-interacting MSAP